MVEGDISPSHKIKNFYSRQNTQFPSKHGVVIWNATEWPCLPRRRRELCWPSASRTYKSSKTTYDLYTGQWFWTTYRLDFRWKGRLIHGATYTRVYYTVPLVMPLNTADASSEYVGCCLRVRFTNVDQISVQLNQVQLDCRFEPSSNHDA